MGGGGWGTHVHPWLIHVSERQTPPQYCKVISLQLKNKSQCRIKKKNLRTALPLPYSCRGPARPRGHPPAPRWDPVAGVRGPRAWQLRERGEWGGPSPGLPSCDGCWVTSRMRLLWSRPLHLSAAVKGHAEPRLSRDAGTESASSFLVITLHVLTWCPMSTLPPVSLTLGHIHGSGHL